MLFDSGQTRGIVDDSFIMWLSFAQRKEKSMKRGNVSSHETKTKPEPLIIRARINGGKPEPIRVLRSTKDPELGEVFRGIPTRFKTNLFQKIFRVESISEEKGINIFHCTTDVTWR
jgi:hypothetical protein